MGERLDEMTGGLRADVVFEASGKPTAMAAALDLAGFRARRVYIGIDVGGSAPAALGQIQSKELQVRGIIGSPGVWPQTLRFLARSGVTSARSSPRPTSWRRPARPWRPC